MLPIIKYPFLRSNLFSIRKEDALVFDGIKDSIRLLNLLNTEGDK
jgi:hypothetical protein